jgi:hypothetical protein
MMGSFRAGWKRRVRPFMVYIFNTMKYMDNKHRGQGEPGIMAQLSDDGRVDMW